MRELSLVVDLSSLERSKSGAVLGEIFWEFPGGAFPGEGWNDFVVVVLTWWVSELKKLAVEGEKSGEFTFMDGPYFGKLMTGDGGMVILSFYRDGSPECLKYSLSVPLSEVSGLILRVAIDVLEFCEKAGWGGDDVRSLSRALEALKSDFSR